MKVTLLGVGGTLMLGLPPVLHHIQEKIISWQEKEKGKPLKESLFSMGFWWLRQ